MPMMPAALLSAAALAAPAISQGDLQYYAGGHGGIAVAKGEVGLELDDSEDSSEIADVDYEDAYQYGVFFGVRHQPTGLRAEVDLARSKADFDSIDIDDGFDAEVGDAKSYSLVGNIAWDFFRQYPIRPYVMGGLGAAWLDLGRVSATSDEGVILDVEDRDADGFAAVLQLGAGLSAVIGGGVELFSGYRFLNTSGIEINSGRFDAQFDYRVHSLEAGVRLYF